MSDTAALKPLKTWSHLAKQRRRPSEYEIVSTNLHFSTDNPECPWEQDSNLFMNQWFRENREGSPLSHEDWNAFRDPDELVYRTYNMMQDGQENYVDGLLEEFDKLGHDAGLSEAWVQALARFYAPGRYPMHALQMASAYISQMAPASTITNCSTFQAADALRWLSRIAYRTKELANAWPTAGFGENERDIWENDPAWQGFRELLEKALTAYDWGEAFVAVCLVAKPAVDETFLHQLALSARRNDDTLLGFMADAQAQDSERARRWAGALVQFALQNEANRDVIEKWIAKWAPLGDAAIDAFCGALPDNATAAEDAKRQARAFRTGLGLSA